MLSDRSQTARIARLRQRTLAAFHRGFPSAPEQGPRGGTAGSTFVDRRLGEVPLLIQTEGELVEEPCCLTVADGVFMMGAYGGTLQIRNADGSLFTDLSGGGIYLVRYSSDGMARWATQITDVDRYNSRASHVDANGNLYVIGNTGGQMNIGIGTTLIYNSDGSVYADLGDMTHVVEAILVKFDPNGFGLWHTRIAYSGENFGLTAGYGSAVDGAGNLLITGGYYKQTTLFDAFGNAVFTLDNSGSDDCLLAKYSPSGTPLWAARIAGSSYEGGIGCTADRDGNIIVTGYYAPNPVSIFNASGDEVFTLDNSGSEDCFLAKYSPLGTPLWATRIAGADYEEGLGCTADRDGNIVVTGQYQSNPVSIFNASGDEVFTLDNSGSEDCFLAKYSPSGTPLWATRIAGSDPELGNSCIADRDGNIVVTGQYQSNPVSIFNASGDEVFTLDNSGFGDCFLTKYSPSGTPLWATRIAGSDWYEIGRGCTADRDGSLYVTGVANGATAYSVSGPSIELATGGFLVKYDSNGTVVWGVTQDGGAGGTSVSVPYFLA